MEIWIIKGCNERRLDACNEHQLVIYEILEKKTKTASGVLYKECCKLVSKPVVPRDYRNYMKKIVREMNVKLFSEKLVNDISRHL